MRRAVLAVAFGLAAFIAVYTVAAAFGLSSDRLGAGADAVTSCDTNGFTIDAIALNGANEVTQLTVGGIASTCAGGQLTVNLTRIDDASIGVGGPVTVSGSTATVDVSGFPNLSDVKHEVIIIVGP